MLAMALAATIHAETIFEGPTITTVNGKTIGSDMVTTPVFGTTAIEMFMTRTITFENSRLEEGEELQYSSCIMLLPQNKLSCSLLSWTVTDRCDEYPRDDACDEFRQISYYNFLDTTVGEFMPGGNGTGIREYLASKDSQYADVKPVHEFGMTENRIYFENKDESVTDFYL